MITDLDDNNQKGHNSSIACMTIINPKCLILVNDASLIAQFQSERGGNGLCMFDEILVLGELNTFVQAMTL
jgi:hypothetical protein